MILNPKPRDVIRTPHPTHTSEPHHDLGSLHGAHSGWYDSIHDDLSHWCRLDVFSAVVLECREVWKDDSTPRRQAVKPLFRDRLHLFTEFAATPGGPDVPDPYYTGEFDLVLDLVEAACRGLLRDLG